ncbi:precursor of CEP14-like [Juglans microcarpa x Juglans regia]|uniref:precursor of CEP14-like n=1 Tax=Juglans microcarpa x Juglans regia TaxID=2249226 RepID=UPI001B7E6593|nr:precursor of CEP14-like [Juglans microcarpa x Juglans regia]
MARSIAVLLFFLVVFAALASCLEGRRLLNVKQIAKRSIPALGGSLILSALPKGPVPSSTPRKKGHAVVAVDEKLIIVRHLISIDRILQSIPSPGAGH